MIESILEEGHIYVMGFSGNSVKVGRTTDPQGDQRIESHKSTARANGSAHLDGQFWISKQHGNSNQTEQQLLEFCRSRGAMLLGREWFSDISYEEVLASAQKLELAPSRKVCYCEKHTLPANCAIPRREDLDGFLRKDLGLTLPPLLEMKFPGEEQFCCSSQMDEVQKLLIRHLTAKADVEFFLALAMNAWNILKGIEDEMEAGADRD